MTREVRKERKEKEVRHEIFIEIFSLSLSCQYRNSTPLPT